MPSCIFKHCKNSSQKQRKEDGISFHRLPADAFIREKWISIIRKSRQDDYWLPSKFCVVCSLHFNENNVYFTNQGRRLLKKTAKPTCNLDKFSVPTSLEKPDLIALALDQADPSNSLGSESPRNILLKSESPRNILLKSESPRNFHEDNSLELEAGDSDLDSIFDSPITSQLKKDLRRQKMLLVATRQKLKNLRQKNRRLEKRNVSLNKILKNLKDKNLINGNIHNLLSEKCNIVPELFHDYLNGKRSGCKTLKHSPAIRKFCLTLNFYSPRGYKYVRKVFDCGLPHPQTLAKWYRYVKSKPGTQEALSDTANTTTTFPHPSDNN